MQNCRKPSYQNRISKGLHVGLAALALVVAQVHIFPSVVWGQVVNTEMENLRELEIDANVLNRRNRGVDFGPYNPRGLNTAEATEFRDPINMEMKDPIHTQNPGEFEIQGNPLGRENHRFEPQGVVPGANDPELNAEGAGEEIDPADRGEIENAEGGRVDNARMQDQNRGHLPAGPIGLMQNRLQPQSFEPGGIDPDFVADGDGRAQENDDSRGEEEFGVDEIIEDLADHGPGVIVRAEIFEVIRDADEKEPVTTDGVDSNFADPGTDSDFGSPLVIGVNGSGCSLVAPGAYAAGHGEMVLLMMAVLYSLKPRFKSRKHY